MLKDVLSRLDYSQFDEIAIVLFASAFFAIIWGVFRLRSDVAERYSQIPIQDSVVDPRKGTPE